jgi:hypothetical protein
MSAQIQRYDQGVGGESDYQAVGDYYKQMVESMGYSSQLARPVQPPGMGGLSRLGPARRLAPPTGPYGAKSRRLAPPLRSGTNTPLAPTGPYGAKNRQSAPSFRPGTTTRSYSVKKASFRSLGSHPALARLVGK